MNQPVSPLVRSADFEHVLKTPTRAKSPHFAVHHVAAPPVRPPRVTKKPASSKLPTADAPEIGSAVDNFSGSVRGLWLGTVVPKRHARRASTRNLIKRQLREAVRRHAAALPAGIWVVRLRQGFDRAQFSSAASDALRATVKQEVDALLVKVASR